MGVEELKKLMTDIKERSEDPEVQTSAILQFIEERLASELKNNKEFQVGKNEELERLP